MRFDNSGVVENGVAGGGLMGIVVYVCVLGMYGVLFTVSLKKRKTIACGIKNPFERMGAVIYDSVVKMRNFANPQVEKDLKLLYPGKKGKRETDYYYVRKMGLVLLLIFIGSVFALGISAGSLTGSMLTDGKYIKRNTYGSGSTSAEFRAEFKEEEWSGEQFTVMINEQKYKTEIVEALSKEVINKLPAVICGDNISLEKVREKLNLVHELEGYPFQIIWQSDNYAVVSEDGTVANDSIGREGENVRLTAVLTYDKYRKETVFEVCVFPKLYSEQERRRKEIREALKKADEVTIYEEKFFLPDAAGNYELTWKEVKKDSSKNVFVLLFAASIGIYFFQDKDLHEKVKKRNHQLLIDYPGMIQKLTLYMGAGMTIRNAFHKIAYDYEKKKASGGKYNNVYNYVYEEMLLSCHELESGASEAAVYEGFGKRCLLPQYTRLGSLLSQNLRKGSTNILSVLQKESLQAFEERKNNARKQGEEAGTKLLLPMMLMLFVVMVLIMIPAYLSFSI